MTVSVIISARNEFPNIVHTVHSIINDLETFLEHDDFEIIIVDNGSTDDRSWRFLAERGMFFHRTVKIVFDPIMGNVSARNKGAEIARGKYLFMSDAHMSYKIGSFKAMIEAIDAYGGIVHPAVQWMGGYWPSDPSYQYSMKLGEKIWGTWNKIRVSAKPFYIPVSGHCCLGLKREEFQRFGGYNGHFRCYGGGEVYLDMKWWMMGSSVMCVPEALGYHLSAGRGYSYKQDDLIHNMMLLASTLGADAMEERVYLRYLGKEGANVAVLDKMRKEAKAEAALDTFAKGAPRSFYDCITDLPWDVKNKELHGTSGSGMLIYDRTWTESLSGRAKDMFDASPLQKGLQTLIDEKWSRFVYHGAPL
jgi:GT2 family glycosyltransferase